MAFLGFFRGKSQDWGEVPTALGMTVSDGGLLQGTWNGTIALRGLHTWEKVERYNTEEMYDYDYRYYTELYAILDPQLLMGLRADAQSWSGRTKDAILGQKDLQVGHPELDRLFKIQAADGDLTRRVLREPVASQMIAGVSIHPKLWISDHYVTIEYPEYERDLRRVRSSLEVVGRIAATILDVRQRELASWEPPLRAAWAPVAQAWGMTLDAPRATIRGVIRGAEVTARTDASGSTCVSVVLPNPLGCDLSLSPQGGDGFFTKIFRGQDIQIGDPVFDDAFVIKGKPEGAVRAVLHPTVRHKLLSILQRASAIKVEGGTLEVWTRWRVMQSEHIDAMLKLTFEAAEALRPQSGS